MDRKTYIEKLNAQLKQWDAQLDQMEAEAEKAQADAKANYYKQVEELRARQNDARKRMEEINRANQDAWEDMKAGTEQAFENMKQAFTDAMSKYK